MSSIRKFGLILLAKDRHAIGVAFVASLLPMIGLPLSFLASVVVALVTLSKGIKSGLSVLAWVALPVIAALALRQTILLSDAVLIKCILVFACAAVYRYKQQWQLVLLIMAAIGVIFVSTIHGVMHNPQQWLTLKIQDYLQTAAASFNIAMPANEMKDVLSFIAPIAWGLAASLFALFVLFEFWLATWWQALIFQPGEASKTVLSLRIHRPGALLALLVFAAVLLLNRNLALDLLPVILLPFALTGLSLAHCLLSSGKHKDANRILLGIMYFVFVLTPYIITPIWVVMGYFDSWVDVRKKRGEEAAQVTQTPV